MRKICILALTMILLVTITILPGCGKEKVNTVIDIPEASTYVSSFTFEEVGNDAYGYVGKIPLYNYELLCCYSAIVDDFMAQQPGYDPEMSVVERLAFREKIIDENRELLQQQAITEHTKMKVMEIRSQHKAVEINDTQKGEISDRWKRYGVQYYDTLKNLYENVKTPDDAMRMMTGCNVKETVKYMQSQASATVMVSKEFYDTVCTNEEIQGYYQQHINDCRIVQIRAVYFTEKDKAKSVKSLMTKRPEDIDNLAKAYNEDPNLAKTNGLVDVNSSCALVPEDVKSWAYAQNSESLFEKHGTIEIFEANGGWYLLLCNDIIEYSDVKGNSVYAAAVQGRKDQILTDRINALLANEDFAVNNMDYEKAKSVMDNAYGGNI